MQLNTDAKLNLINLVLKAVKTSVTMSTLQYLTSGKEGYDSKSITEIIKNRQLEMNHYNVYIIAKKQYMEDHENNDFFDITGLWIDMEEDKTIINPVWLSQQPEKDYFKIEESLNIIEKICDKYNKSFL